MFCREVVNLMSLLKAVQHMSDQNLTIFQSVHPYSFFLPGSSKLHGLTQPHRTGKNQRQLWVSGEHILDYSSRNLYSDSTWLSLRKSTLGFNKKRKMSLFSHEREIILDMSFCVIVLIHQSSASAITQGCSSCVQIADVCDVFATRIRLTGEREASMCFIFPQHTGGVEPFRFLGWD